MWVSVHWLPRKGFSWLEVTLCLAKEQKWEMKELKRKGILESWGWRSVGKGPLSSSKTSLIIGSLGVTKTVWLTTGKAGDLYVGPRSHKEVNSWRAEVRKSGKHAAEVIKPEWKDSWLIRTGIWQCGRKGSLPAPYTNYWTNVVKYCLLWIKLLNITLCQECSTRHGTWAKSITWFSIMDMPKCNTH